MSTIAVNCTDQITQMLADSQVLGVGISGKTFAVYSEEDLMDKAKMIKKPAIGVMYEGIRPNGGDPSRQGLSNDLTVALVLMLEGKSIGAYDCKNVAAEVLDAMRASIRTKQSPTGHKWRFAGEISAGQVNGVVLYIQRWSTMIAITS